jgi:hypothetical protein
MKTGAVSRQRENWQAEQEWRFGLGLKTRMSIRIFRNISPEITA